MRSGYFRCIELVKVLIILSIDIAFFGKGVAWRWARDRLVVNVQNLETVSRRRRETMEYIIEWEAGRCLTS